LQTQNQIGLLAEVNSRDIAILVELHGEKDISKVSRLRIIVEADEEPPVVAR
jgi:hypothetical protein